MILSNEEIGKEIQKLDREIKLIRENIVQLCWWMRGSLTYSEAWQLSEFDRNAMNKLIKENIETMNKTGVQLI